MFIAGIAYVRLRKRRQIDARFAAMAEDAEKPNCFPRDSAVEKEA